MRLLVLLQNAYDRGELANGYSPGRWYKELSKSRTGRRLYLAIPDLRDLGFYHAKNVRFANACPGIGDGPDSQLAPCLRHTRRAISRVKPDAVMACGKVAEEVAMEVWDGPLFVIPHPAFRLLSDDLLTKCRNTIAWWQYHRESREVAVPSEFWHAELSCPRIAFRQGVGKVDIELI